MPRSWMLFCSTASRVHTLRFGHHPKQHTKLAVSLCRLGRGAKLPSRFGQEEATLSWLSPMRLPTNGGAGAGASRPGSPDGTVCCLKKTRGLITSWPSIADCQLRNKPALDVQCGGASRPGSPNDGSL